MFTASAKADYPPEVVDKMGNPIINQSELYSGMYGRVNVTFFPYAFGGKKGIGCGLGPVQKLRDGEALGGSAPTAAQAFGAPAGNTGPERRIRTGLRTGAAAGQSDYRHAVLRKIVRGLRAPQGAGGELHETSQYRY